MSDESAERSTCIVCKEEIGECWLDLGRQPYANKYPLDAPVFKKEEFHNLNVNFCSNCDFAWLSFIAPRSEMFEDYYYLSSINQELVSHFSELAATLAEISVQSVLDIGSNDGVLLNELKLRAIEFLGVDPSENVGAIANQKGLTTEVGFFDRSMVKHLKSQGLSFDCIVASSVVTHLEDPIEFLSLAKEVMSDLGLLVIEVESIHQIIKTVGFERFYFDRPYYYSPYTFAKLAEGVGLHALCWENIASHGGSFRVVLCNQVASSNNEVIKKASVLACEKNFQRLSLEAVAEFPHAVHKAADELKNCLKEMRASGQRVAAYGCPARFSTITNFARIDEGLIPFVVDDSPLKLGRFSPGQHIPIVDFEKLEAFSPDVIFVFAYEYFSSISKKCKNLNSIWFRPIPLAELKVTSL